MKTNAKSNPLLDKKLAAYTLAGAAVLAAPAAKADTITYVPNVDVTVSQSSVPNTYTFLDITLSADNNNGNEVYASGASGAMVLDSYYFTAADLAFGNIIDPAASGWATGGKLTTYYADNSTGGDWPNNGGTGYLAFYFVGTDGPQAGWAEISTTANASTSSFELLSYAYENDANTPITAGETSTTPEPSTMALVALGAAGLVALRRRRKVNA